MVIDWCQTIANSNIVLEENSFDRKIIENCLKNIAEFEKY